MSDPCNRENHDGPIVGRRTVIAAGSAALGLTTGRSGLDGSSAPETRERSVFPSRSFLFAGDFGVVGRGDVDETQTVQSFLDLCAASGGRTAHFGSLRVRIGGPLFARGVGVVFDRAGYGVDDPGFHVQGDGYTALTVTGMIADFNATIYGDGDVVFGADGRIVRDTRPRVNGFQFGGPDEDAPLIASVVRHARAYKLSGFGIRHTTCFDTTFLAQSAELCGNEDHYAFEVSGSPTNNCNESVWMRVQVEQSAIRAMFIHTNTLSCAFSKIHSERTTAVAGAPTWRFGGACEFGSVRLNARNPEHASAQVISAQAECRNLRVEGDIPVAVDATLGVVNFHNPVATLIPAPGQNGQVNVIGGQVRALAIGAGWTFTGTRLDVLEAGFMPPATWSTAIGCNVRRIAPQSGASQGEINLQSCRADGLVAAANGRLRGLRLLDGTRLSPAGGSLEITDDQQVTVDNSSTIAGACRVHGGRLRLHGRVEGDLLIEGPSRCTAGQEAVVTGRVAGWTPPDAVGGEPIPEGTYCKNLTPAVSQSTQGARIITGWVRAGVRWVAITAPA